MKTGRRLACAVLLVLCMSLRFPFSANAAKKYNAGDWVTTKELFEFYDLNPDDYYASDIPSVLGQKMAASNDELSPVQIKATLVEVHHTVMNHINFTFYWNSPAMDEYSIPCDQIGTQFLLGAKPITIEGSHSADHVRADRYYLDPSEIKDYYSYNYGFTLSNVILTPYTGKDKEEYIKHPFSSEDFLPFDLHFDMENHIEAYTYADWKGMDPFETNRKGSISEKGLTRRLEARVYKDADAYMSGMELETHIAEKNEVYLRVGFAVDENMETNTYIAKSDIDLLFRLDEVQLGEAAEGIAGTITTRADSDTGETGVSIPAAIATAIIGGVAALAGAGAGANADAGNDDEKKKNRYEMRLHKDFGDTILVGERVAVYARIVEITPDGAETSRSDLTAQISIRSPHYLMVSGEGISGEHKAAYVEAPETAADIPSEAVVSFKFDGGDSSFTNNVIFQIGEQKIVFGQENLTLPAGYDKTERLPFAVFGMGKDVVVTASVIREDGYSAQIEPGEEENLYYALITEKNKSEGEAGDYDSYTLEIKATGGGRTIAGELPLYRFHMGLRLDVGSIGCYAEEYDPANHQSTLFKFTANGKQYVPAETKATLTLYDWDIENHKIFQVAPVITGFEIQALQDEDQPMLEKLGIQCEVLEGEPGGRRSVLFRCCKGALDAPNRFQAAITLTVTRDGEEQEKVMLKKEVLMRSQPLREHKSPEEGVAAIKADRHLTERLEHIRGAICAQGYLNNLFPLVKTIDVMLSGYDDAYGYDAYQLETVQQIWNGFLAGDIIGANTEPETFTMMGELWSVLTGQAVDLYEKASAFEQSLGFMERLALGFVTFGKSEMAFTTIAGIRAMKEYVEEGGDSTLEAFRLGAKVATIDYLNSKAAEKVLGTALKSKAAASVGRSVKAATVKSVESVKRFSSAVTGRTTKAAISNSVNAKNLASAKAGQLVESGKRGLGKSAEQLELDKALRAGREFAKEQVGNLQAAEWQYRLNPTDANRKLLDNLTIQVQQNKLAMYQLQDYADEGLTAARKGFNETLASFYGKADTLAKSELSAITGVPANQIKIVNASASSKAMLESGKKITMDRDWTAYYVDSKGQMVYFDQITTEHIYNKSFYKAATGYESADLKIANRFAKKTDQTVIQDILGHRESYGSDLPNVMDKGLHGTALNNKGKVASSVSYKGKERFAESDWLLKQAESMTDTAERELARARALSERIEGYRQLTKQFDNFIRPRDVARRVGAEVSKIPEKTHVAVELCRKLLATNSTVSVSDLENGLRSLGFTAESFADALGDAVLQIG